MARAISSRDLGIDLGSAREAELFKWLLACLLLGRPIQQQVARRAYLELAGEGLVTPRAILAAGWDRLVRALDRGHYVRFDFSTAARLLDVAGALLERYGTVSRLLRASATRAEAGRRLQAFKGIGPTTARIFLGDVVREGAWPRPAGARRRA